MNTPGIPGGGAPGGETGGISLPPIRRGPDGGPMGGPSGQNRGPQLPRGLGNPSLAGQTSGELQRPDISGANGPERGQEAAAQTTEQRDAEPAAEEAKAEEAVKDAITAGVYGLANAVPVDAGRDAAGASASAEPAISVTPTEIADPASDQTKTIAAANQANDGARPQTASTPVTTPATESGNHPDVPANADQSQNVPDPQPARTSPVPGQSPQQPATPDADQQQGAPTARPGAEQTPIGGSSQPADQQNNPGAPSTEQTDQSSQGSLDISGASRPSGSEEQQGGQPPQARTEQGSGNAPEAGRKDTQQTTTQKEKALEQTSGTTPPPAEEDNGSATEKQEPKKSWQERKQEVFDEAVDKDRKRYEKLKADAFKEDPDFKDDYDDFMDVKKSELIAAKKKALGLGKDDVLPADAVAEVEAEMQKAEARHMRELLAEREDRAQHEDKYGNKLKRGKGELYVDWFLYEKNEQARDKVREEVKNDKDMPEEERESTYQNILKEAREAYKPGGGGLGKAWRGLNKFASFIGPKKMGEEFKLAGTDFGLAWRNGGLLFFTKKEGRIYFGQALKHLLSALWRLAVISPVLYAAASGLSLLAVTMVTMQSARFLGKGGS